MGRVMQGSGPASALYVRSKKKNARQVGIDSEDHRLPSETSTEQLIELISVLNRDESVSGILGQQPLPPKIDVGGSVTAVTPTKHLDGFNRLNAGLTTLGLPAD